MSRFSAVTARPLVEPIRRKLFGTEASGLEAQAVERWTIEPPSTAYVPPAFFLPGQMERILATPYASEDVHQAMHGNYETAHSATEGMLLRNVELVDGVLYAGDTAVHLHPRQESPFNVRIEEEMDHAALYCTPGGNRYFGQWLIDDCPTYELAAQAGMPVTTGQPLFLHTEGYESWLEMSPVRKRRVRFRELVVFSDVGQNENKSARRYRMTDKLLSHVQVDRHPGVFLLRGDAGQRRVMENELEIAERLRVSRGFRVVDPMKLTVPQIIDQCAGAQTVIGVEGSALMNGVQLQAPGDNIVVLQPPRRFVWVYKHLADRDGQNFAFVVGRPEGDGDDFSIDLDEVERTLDLLPG